MQYAQAYFEVALSIAHIDNLYALVQRKLTSAQGRALAPYFALIHVMLISTAIAPCFVPICC
jgi:hypothetical protein